MPDATRPLSKARAARGTDADCAGWRAFQAVNADKLAGSVGIAPSSMTQLRPSLDQPVTNSARSSFKALFTMTAGTCASESRDAPRSARGGPSRTRVDQNESTPVENECLPNCASIMTTGFVAACAVRKPSSHLTVVHGATEKRHATRVTLPWRSRTDARTVPAKPGPRGCGSGIVKMPSASRWPRPTSSTPAMRLPT
jgi:hypothetical protein